MPPPVNAIRFLASTGFEMPTNVAWFERLMYIDIAASLLIAILEHAERSTEEIAQLGMFYLIALPLLVGLVVLLIWLIVQRRMNWARWALLLLVVAGDLSLLHDLLAGEFARKAFAIALLTAVTFVLEIAAFYLIFTGNARDWFRKPSSI